MPKPSRHDPHNPASRPTLISKALSRLLRHAAVQERVPIDSLGYVRVDQLLAWRGLNKFSPKVELEDVVEAVRESDKQRFGLKYLGEKDGKQAESNGPGKDEEEGLEVEVESDTQRALRVFDSGADREARRFSVRATQGHSMVGVSTEGLLKPIGLDEVPETVVHGTFYGAWEAILREGNVRCMGRNHVHFSTGPGVEVARSAEGKTEGKGDKGRLGKLMAQAGVVSGMRKDAEVLIYVDVKKALARGMKWWRSENGVVLTDGALRPGPETVENDDQSGKDREEKSPSGSADGVLSEFWTEVVEVKEGLGTLWKDGSVVQELPERLRGRPLPMGKSRRGGRGGGGAGRGNAEGGGRGRGQERGKAQDKRGGHRGTTVREEALADREQGEGA